MKVIISENSHIGNHRQEEFGYNQTIQKRDQPNLATSQREEIRKESSYVLATCWNLMSKYDDDFRNYFLEIP